MPDGDGQGAPAVNFKVPVMTTGDVYARYLVRLEEIQQSLHIIRQLIDRIVVDGLDVPRAQGRADEGAQVFHALVERLRQGRRRGCGRGGSRLAHGRVSLTGGDARAGARRRS